jgi:16S rRNA (adenine1518-N6/adenine1519-N6)-dimethyltransferase
VSTVADSPSPPGTGDRPGASDRPGAPARPGEAAEPAASGQPSLRRMRRFDVHPDRELGQNFLIDSNILGVIDRAAQLAREDVVLEIGGGLGVLSEYLAERVHHVHVIEIDTRLRAALGDATDPYTNVTVSWGDAMVLDLARLRPAPNKVVANLPYGIAAGVLLRTIEELPAVNRWVAMAQREVGERLAAAPGGGSYGVPSVIAQLACEVEVLRAIPRTVFHPVPNVDSVLVGMRRRTPVAGPGRGEERPAGSSTDSRSVPSAALRALVRGAFAHRRKTLVGSLSLSDRGSAGHSRELVRHALLQLGHPPDVRAERLSPQDFLALARLLEL